MSAFDCGVESLNSWLRQRALKSQVDGAARTFVVLHGATVAAYYAVAAGSVEHADAPGKVRRNMPDPIPAMVLARLAVDRRWAGKGLGSALLADAIRRTVQAAEIIGIRAVLVHAISEEAALFYERHGFRRSPIQPLTLVVTLNEIVASLP